MAIAYSDVTDRLVEHLFLEADFADSKEDLRREALNNRLGVDLHGLGNAISFTLAELEREHDFKFKPDDADDIGLDVRKYYKKSGGFRLLNFFLPFRDDQGTPEKPDLLATEVADCIWEKIPEDAK